jgi:hypothetical protein
MSEMEPPTVKSVVDAPPVRRWAAWATAAGSAAFGLLHWYWGAGGHWMYLESTIPGNIPMAIRHDWSYTLPMLWGVGAVCLLGAAVALATVRHWSSPLLRRFLLVACWIGFALIGFRAVGNVVQHMIVAAGMMHLDPSWDTFMRMDLRYFCPWFATWAVLWGFTAVQYRRATRWPRGRAVGPDEIS